MSGVRVSDYPEHKKLKEVSDKTQAIWDFLEWLGEEKDYYLAYDEDKYPDTSGLPINEPIRGLIAEFYEIDNDKLEKEKDQMLEDLRNMNKESENETTGA